MIYSSTTGEPLISQTMSISGNITIKTGYPRTISIWDIESDSTITFWQEITEDKSIKKRSNSVYRIQPRLSIPEQNKLNHRTKKHLNMDHRCRRYFWGRN